MDSQQETTMEAAYKVLCRKMWLNSKPANLKLTRQEEGLLQQLFPREKVKKRGRPATGTGSDAIMKAVAENMYFAETGNKRKARKLLEHSVEAMQASHIKYGEQYEDGYIFKEGKPQPLNKAERTTLRKAVSRGQEALRSEIVNRPKRMRPSIEGQYDKQIIERALQEIKKRET